MHKTVDQNKICTKHLVDPCFQGVYRLFVLSFKTKNGRTSHSNYYLPKDKNKILQSHDRW